MIEPVIKVENLSKLYHLGQFSTGTISRDIERWWAIKRGKEDPFLKIGEANNRNTKGTSDIVWSLKDINFEFEKGSAVGIIGKNGAGKSTLLKVLSQITSPTTGKVKIKGRIASLLEVGTGFHPELSGRENIFLNGAILGMRKREIERKFDEIIDFAGVERYVDTPVKRYSSGMYVRLAFAVAAHLESEILIVDEVLAVGDAEFQQKCLGKMGEISTGEGRTILFVSHNMMAIKQLCSKAILLNDGMIASNGDTNSVIKDYLGSDLMHKSYVEINDKFKPGYNNKVKFTRVWMTGIDNKVRRKFLMDESIIFHIEFKTDINFKSGEIDLAIQIVSSDGVKLCYMYNKDSNVLTPTLSGTMMARVKMSNLSFYPDLYYVNFFIGEKSEACDYVESALSFEISGAGTRTNRELPREMGMLFLTPEWQFSS
jgi:lipopolysaccharide transport system ATP-binding protein